MSAPSTEPKATAGGCPDSAVAFGSALNKVPAPSASCTPGVGRRPNYDFENPRGVGILSCRYVTQFMDASGIRRFFLAGSV